MLKRIFIKLIGQIHLNPIAESPDIDEKSLANVAARLFFLDTLSLKIIPWIPRFNWL